MDEFDMWEPGTRTLAEWRAIRNYLIEALSTFLQQDIALDEPIEDSLVDDESICCHIRYEGHPPSPLMMQWLGQLLVEPLDGETFVSARLIVFLNGERVRMEGHRSSMLQLVFKPNGTWKSLGWLEDVEGQAVYS